MKANIDSIIEKSMKKTEELNHQLKSIEDKFNLNNVSLTGDDGDNGTKTSIYQMDGEVVSRKQIHDAKEKLALQQRTFIDIGSRKKPRYVPPPKKDTEAKADTAPQKKKFKGWKA